MKTNGLLSSDQVEAIFLNLEQLIQANTQFTAKLDVALQDAINSDDLDFVEVSIGNLFLKSTDLMMAFESYCVNQSHAGNLLEQLEKEKELLRIFLQASQDDNVALRRMPLKSFLILPVQRIMRYPLLLERLYKSTSSENPDKMAIMAAKAKMEEILAHINSKTQKSSGSMKMKKKVADLLLQRQAHSMEKVELNRAAIDILGWNKKDVCDITTCRLQVAVSADHWATKRPRHKFSTVQGILLTLGKGELHQTDVDDILFPRKTQVIQAAVVLLKEKNGKYQTLREPFMLNRCIVNHDPDSDDTFEVLEINKEPFVFKGEDTDVKLWLKNMKQQTIDLASWRKRRNALPNIMIKHLV
ncbi:phosphatidylinositol 3,4,5-trisphosphate-dependent Rac exchanger 1 protein-like [Argopecten irradians]